MIVVVVRGARVVLVVVRIVDAIAAQLGQQLVLVLDAPLARPELLLGNCYFGGYGMVNKK